MNVYVFNGCLIVSSLLTWFGLYMMSPALGAMGAGFLLVAYVCLAIKVSGGLYMPGKPEDKDQG